MISGQVQTLIQVVPQISAGTSGADSSSAATSYTITDEEIAAAYANTDNSYDAMYLSRQPGNPAGTYETVHYYSTTAGTTRQACVMLPTEYDPSKDYPVVYLLHGLGGNDEAWKDMGADCIAENLHIYQNVPQMILVGVDSVILSEAVLLTLICGVSLPLMMLQLTILLMI